ncbi:glycosyltransferase involved in cell wall biosynthesis [Pontibacter aydingkolensis]|uniref:Glycosyltransferase n=1 Tax=Pontibacter aydingkolensis TaxID=1911536 RepID=A0ABS7CTN2_9BACT|nr:glycosyltransferase family 2 protein [Pontibacter aydingkolensis]MBW7467211.1 glycosyltransferase [Pontibacter aydingkolensis]
MNKPLVSVLMTSFNREKYIAQAIKSVLDSTLTDFELIIVDDCSKDRTLSIARSYAARDTRVKVHLNDYNLGDYANRNRAAFYAKGKYLKYVDADDYIYSHGLEVMVSMMEQHPEAGFGLCTIAPYSEKPFPICLSPKEAYEFNYLKNVPIFHRAPLSSIIKKDIFETQGGFYNQRMVGDFELWHRLSLSYPIVLMPQGLIWNRVHEGQEMSSHSRYVMDYLFIAEKYIELCSLSGKNKAFILDKIRRNQLVTMIKNPMGLGFVQRLKLVKRSNINLFRIFHSSSRFSSNS